MTMVSFKLIHTPIQIVDVEIKNRVVRSAHGTNIGRGEINDDLIAYHVQRAKGGVGLTFIEYCSVHPSNYSPQLNSWDDSIIPRYRKLMEAVAPYGMTVFQQLSHGGLIYPGLDGVAWSASAVTSPITGAVAHAMSKGEIDALVEAFAKAAKRCVEGGVQGIEVHFANGYLIQQFLSPLTNHRTDEYGGGRENRMRFGRRVLEAIRAVTPARYPLGIRLSDQHAPGGLEAEEAAIMAREFEADGLIDFVHGALGSYHVLPRMLPGMDYPVGSMMPVSSDVIGSVEQAVRIVTPSRIRTLEEADQILRDGLADMVTIQRAHIADPMLVNKTLEGRADEVRPCIACNQGCVGGLLSPASRLGCAVNPAVGFEQYLSEDLIVPTDNPRKVLVVGGGPAGMEAARVAALSGNKVVLAEAAPVLGGLIEVAKRAPKLYVLGDYTNWLEREIFRLGVEVRLSTYMDADDILNEQPDAVILATGSMPRMDGVQCAIPGEPAAGVSAPHVLSAVDLITGNGPIAGTSAVIFDDVGHYEALAAAEVLIERGFAVTLATRFAMLAPTVETWTRVEPTLERLLKGDFTVKTRQQLVEIKEGESILKPLQGDRPEAVAADVVVMVLARDPLNELEEELRGKVPELVVVGDAMSPRDLQAAVREGHRAARALFATEGQLEAA